MNNNCPKCNAPLQEGALFCPHCMTQLAEKQELDTPKIKKAKSKKLIISAIALVLIASVSIGSVLIINHKKHMPICTVEQFKEAAPVASEKMGLEKIWNPESLVDIVSIEDKNIVRYTADTYLDDAVLSVFFFNKGEQVLAYFSDVAPEDFNDAESVIKCITQSVSGYYYTDIDDVFDNEKLYPKQKTTVPFDSYYTDLISRTEQYNNDIKNGTVITTRFIEIQDESKLNVVYFITERNTNGSIIYDLSLNIYRD